MNTKLPASQYAVQLVGPSELTLNQDKPVYEPGPTQIVVRVDAVGLCFSDLKLLKQFSEHARKTDILRGIERSILEEIPSYKPDGESTVPGHETTGTIVAVGADVTHYQVGQRILVQTDYRWLPTAGSNASFGYNFEGGLQQYVLLDERVIIDPVSGDAFLIPVPDSLSHAAVGLVEPWACVESAYITEERNTVLPGGKLLVAAESGTTVSDLTKCLGAEGAPASVTVYAAQSSQTDQLAALGCPVQKVQALDELPDAGFDDIIYFGSSKATLDVLNDKLAPSGIMNVVLAGQTIGEDVLVGVGRIHYGLCRWIGTTSADAAESYQTIPPDGEVRDQEKAIVIGAGGPMGQMHTIRLICSGKPGISVTATDFDNERLQTLHGMAHGFAEQLGVDLRLNNPQEEPLDETFGYYALMAPIGALVAQAVAQSQDRTIINVFAGIPGPVKQLLDMDTYIKNHCYMIGTSGSRFSDMMIVLNKTIAGQLNTNCSVSAVTGMAGAIDGIKAVEDRTIAGKIVVYPGLPDMPLINLPDLAEIYPTVVEKLDGGLWTKAAEEELLRVAQ
jgi:L-sorbose 1-phosphate reductase